MFETPDQARIKFIKHLWFGIQACCLISLQFAIVGLIYYILHYDSSGVTMVRCHIESESIHAGIDIQELQGTIISSESWISVTLSYKSDHYRLEKYPISLSRLNELVVDPTELDFRSQGENGTNNNEHFVKMDLTASIGGVSISQIMYIHDTTNCFMQPRFHERDSSTNQTTVEQMDDDPSIFQESQQEYYIDSLWLEPQTFWDYSTLILCVLISIDTIWVSIWILRKIIKNCDSDPNDRHIPQDNEKKLVLKWTTEIKRLSENDPNKNNYCFGCVWPRKKSKPLFGILTLDDR